MLGDVCQDASPRMLLSNARTIAIQANVQRSMQSPFGNPHADHLDGILIALCGFWNDQFFHGCGHQTGSGIVT